VHELVEGGVARRRAHRIAALEAAWSPLSSSERTWKSTLAPSRCSTRTGTSGATRATIAGTPKIATSSADATAARLQPTTLTRVRPSIAPTCRMAPARAANAVASAGSRISRRASSGLLMRPRRSTPSGAEKAAMSA
jgi:hypothetical protein